MTSFHKSFAIVGFGGIGSLLLAEFVKGEEASPHGYKLRVLTRAGSKKPELEEYAKRGVEIFGVDYSSPESITRALQGVDVVISTLRDDGLKIQTDIIRAAKTANVKLFVPSEYGVNTLGATHEYLKVKTEAHDLLKTLAVPYALFFVGFIPETTFANPIGTTDFKDGKFVLFDDGNSPISWTSKHSISTYVHHVLSTLPASALANRVFKIEGERKTWRQIIAVWEAKHSAKAQVHCMGDDEDELQKFRAAEAQNPFAIFVSHATRDGSGVTGGEDNAVWPGWNPLKWEDIMI